MLGAPCLFFRRVFLSKLTTDTPLTFELVCKDGTLRTLGDVMRVLGDLTPEQRDTFYWTNAIHMLNTAIREPHYIKAATITVQTALALSGMLGDG